MSNGAQQNQHSPSVSRLLRLRTGEIALIVLTAAALIVGVIAIVITHWDLEKVHARLGSFAVTPGNDVTFDGKPTEIPKGPVQIQFWTPSAKTKDAPDAADWEKMESDDKLDAFGKKLMDANVVKGYRRHEIVGAGRGGRRVGAWWVSSNDADFRLQDFLRAYLDFWKPSEDHVYMEIQLVDRGYRGN